MQEFEGRVSVVTGAASGIGLALCKKFAEQGCRVVLADIEAPALAAAEAEVAALGADTLAIPCNVSDADAVEQLAQQCVDHFGAIHIACNNAGVFTSGELWEASRGDYDWLIQVNLYGVINGIRSFIPRMLANGQECHMVNTASMAALTTTPCSGIYHMTKHAVLALSECLYHELAISAPHVGVSCLCPELFSTGIGNSERNRPAQWGDALGSESRSLATEAIMAAVATGKDPRELAERVLQAVTGRQFYILSEDAWRDAAHSRLDDVRMARNPTLVMPEV